MTARIRIYLDIAGVDEARGVVILAMDRAEVASVRANILRVGVKKLCRRRVIRRCGKEVFESSVIDLTNEFE